MSAHRLAAVLALKPLTRSPEPDIDPASHARRQANRDKQAAYVRARYQRDPSRFHASQAHRRAVKLSRMPVWADRKAIAQVFVQAKRMTRETGIRYSVDHIIPLQGETVSGLHVHTNLRVITHRENSRKGNRAEGEWVSETSAPEPLRI